MNRDRLKQEPSGDLISREETLTAFADYVGSGMSMDDYDALWDIVAKMPAVKQEPRFIAKSDGTIEQIKECTEQEPCGDAIDRAEAIKVASGYCHPANVAKELAKLPPVNPQLCEDAISRQAAIKAAMQDVNDKRTHGFIAGATRAANRIKLLPPVNPQPKTGHWILDDDKEHGRCSECGCKEDLVDGHSSYKWCSNCGARMIEPHESEDKCKNCEYSHNPDYTRCHECRAESEGK